VLVVRQRPKCDAAVTLFAGGFASGAQRAACGKKRRGRQQQIRPPRHADGSKQLHLDVGITAVSKPILILNGPNLNLLGRREPHIYGATTLAEVEEMCRRRAATRGLAIAFRQSNSEAQIIDWIHGGIDGACGIIINAAAFTHTSVAILDALKMVSQPVIELHISNPHRREPFRHHSYVTPAATAIICGLGVNGYPLAVDAMADLLEARAAAPTQSA
jgi:3-dehydroquinate dehydratase II